MTIGVRLFARARDLAEAEVLKLELPPGATVGDLRRRLVEQSPALAPLQRSLLVAVNNDYAPDTLSLNETQEIACFPPVSGG